MIRLYIIAGLVGLVAVTASYGLGRWQGYGSGRAAEAAQNAADLQKTQSRLHKTADSLSEAHARLVAVRAEQEDLIRRIEDEARTDSDPCRAPSANSLSRLKRRWRSQD